MFTAIDVGGTFTDVASWDGSRLTTGKVPSTVEPSDGVIAGLERVAGSSPGRLLHGSTVATNTVLERSGARTTLVTDAGFEDLIEVGRQDRPSLYDLDRVRPSSLAPRDRRVGVPGRAAVGGGGAGGLGEWIDALVATDPESVAVSFLYSYADGGRERDVLDAIASRLPDVAVSLSSEVVPEFREFERMSTTLLNAYLVPRTASYLTSLAGRVAASGVVGDPVVMRSSGGLISLDEAARLPASIVLSGPAGGVVAAAAIGRALGHDHVVSFDMGGTSTDVCRIEDSRPEVRYESSIDGLPYRLPSVAIHTVGAGGGSIGWMDPGGALRVGPRSAGAVPGPASYGGGGVEPAVTDANLVTGRIGSGAQLGGDLSLDHEAAERALHRLAGALGMATDEVALGMIEVVEAHMERAISAVSVEEGADPRSAFLVAFGGAGGLHATALARRLDMAGVVVPSHAGVFSAFGLLLAPPRADAARSVLMQVGADDALDRAVDDVMTRARERLGATPVNEQVVVDVRYRGQSHETSIPYRLGAGWEHLGDEFHSAHLRRNGFNRPDDPIEVVTVRAEVTGNPAVTWDDIEMPAPSGDSRRGRREVAIRGGTADATVWWRPGLRSDDEVVGPAVIEEPEATTFLAAGERARVHASGALVVEW